jgi:hypothetical protein
MRGRGNRWVCVLLFGVLIAAGTGRAEETPEGFRLTPSVGWKHGNQSIDFWLDFRYRWEDWNARVTQAESFSGFRTRFGLSYWYAKKLGVLVEAQQTSVLSLSNLSSGAGASYYDSSNRETNPNSIRVKRLFVDWRPSENTEIKLGRQNMNMGTWVKYAEPDWRYLKYGRMSQRLVGEVGWSNVTRSFDGGIALAAIGGHHLAGFAAQPTQGVFAVNAAFKWLSDVIAGGLEWTAPPGVLIDDVDFSAFFTGYDDSRSSTRYRPDGRMVSAVTVYTFGGSLATIFDLGPGRVDGLLWGAYQFGDFPDLSGSAGRPRLSQSAGALLAEFGYQLPAVHGKPWLRSGVNFATGDDDPSDGRHGTFFNQLPTNHGYYGYVDQLAFQNLIDWFAQLRWSPIDRLAFEAFGHRFWLAEVSDSRYFGTGAYKQNLFGFGATPSNGSQDVGWELDIVLTYTLTKQISLSGGYGQLFGGAVFAVQPNHGDVQWGFLQLSLSY